MWMGDRRRFLTHSGLLLGAVALDPSVRSLAEIAAFPDPSVTAGSDPHSLCNINLQTAIGLGDQFAGIVDGHGVLDSRNAFVRVDLGDGSAERSDLVWTQSLEEGGWPVVETMARSPRGSLAWTVYSADVVKSGADYGQIGSGDLPHAIELAFPYVTHIDLSGGVVTSGDRVLALISDAAGATVTQARYNFLTPVKETFSIRQIPGSVPPHYPGFDPAFNGGRTSFLFRPLIYRFPVDPDQTFHVVLGIIAGGNLTYWPKPGESLLKLSVNDQAFVLDLDNLTPGQPFLHEFVVHNAGSELRVVSETDPSSVMPFREALLNGIWIFTGPVDLQQVAAGKLSSQAKFYVRCGEEKLEDCACRVRLAGSSSAPRTVCLPYNLSSSEHQTPAQSSATARAAARDRWETLLAQGAEFTTGNAKLDSLYRTSLINVFLLRTKYAGVGDSGSDLYVLKPGARIYDAFWYRDGAYLSAALDVASHLSEAEKSLRLFWQTGLPGNFGAYEQQQNGSWQMPLEEYDGQGQAMWALVHHAQFSGDRAWFRKVYPNLRRGAAWIRDAIAQTRFVTEDGTRPIYYGLLPSGEGEAIGEGYNYYHDYWAVFGLDSALEAAESLGETNDASWIRQTREQFRADLLASIHQAFEQVGQGAYIPATPYTINTKFDIWGSIAALYPTRFLDPHDPMITRTLDLMRQHAVEDEYTFFIRRKIWTYITVDWAMCYLLRDDLANFHQLYDGYVAHSSATNAWIEEIFLDTRIGTGDMPHGWAAAQYVHMHRNALVFEDGDMLHLCRGAKEEWIGNGITVKRATTQFGTVNFQLSRSSASLALSYRFSQGSTQDKCRGIQLHLPVFSEPVASVRVNGTLRTLSAGQRVLQLE